MWSKSWSCREVCYIWASVRADNDTSTEIKRKIMLASKPSVEALVKNWGGQGSYLKPPERSKEDPGRNNFEQIHSLESHLTPMNLVNSSTRSKNSHRQNQVFKSDTNNNRESNEKKLIYHDCSLRAWLSLQINSHHNWNLFVVFLGIQFTFHAYSLRLS